ncbi:MAG: hypothetical protein HRT94_09430 [Alphaproteobacteria bacterium]|nr:hypothetical protein [Alphaproteobacteria bacterium]
MFEKFLKKSKTRKPLKGQKAIDALYQSIQTRPRPEDVAELVLDVIGNQLNSEQTRLLEKAAKNSLAQNIWGYSSMASDFLRPEGAEKQVRKTEELFSVKQELSSSECLQPETVQEFLNSVSSDIGYKIGESNFKEHRLNKEEREKEGLDLSKRQYNKRWRLLKRLENKIHRMIECHRKYNFTRIGNTALATRIKQEELARDVPTACFIAYYSARMNMRSVFTNTSQTRAYDEVSEMLYRHAVRSPSVNWLAIAYIHPEQEVLQNLTESQKGELLGTWFGILQDIADMLKDVWEKTNVNLGTMIVERGNDSSTWNQTASAWNKARDHWVALLHSMGLSRLLDDVCPGKVLRLMAADVAAWHRASGKDVHPDTKIWAALPRPWEVLKGEAQCTKDMVEKACKKYRVPPTGWTGPRPPKKPVEFTPTPELVHGVAISSPGLAKVLKEAKWFSGKLSEPVDIDILVERDEGGFALSAKES